MCQFGERCISYNKLERRDFIGNFWGNRLSRFDSFMDGREIFGVDFGLVNCGHFYLANQSAFSI